jgi:hypothetical protein
MSIDVAAELRSSSRSAKRWSVVFIPAVALLAVGARGIALLVANGFFSSLLLAFFGAGTIALALGAWRAALSDRERVWFVASVASGILAEIVLIILTNMTFYYLNFFLFRGFSSCLICLGAFVGMRIGKLDYTWLALHVFLVTTAWFVFDIVGSGVGVLVLLVLAAVAPLIAFLRNDPVADARRRAAVQEAQVAADLAARAAELRRWEDAYALAHDGQRPPAGFVSQLAMANSSVGRTNVMAILAFVFAFVSSGLLGIIFGHVAVAQIVRTGERGLGLAKAAIIVGYVGLAIAAIALLAFIAANRS